MKKILLGMMILIMALCLTSCSQELTAKLAEFMGNMGKNVYGIEPSMQQVEAATNTIKGSVKDNGDGTVKIDINASDFIASVTEVKNSAQKTEALKEELAKPVSENEEEQAKIKAALEEKVAEINTALASIPEGTSELVDNLIASIGEIKISDNPTNAELATVAVIMSVQETVSDLFADGGASLMDENGITEEGLKAVDAGLGALDALKVVSEVAGIEIGDDILMGVVDTFKTVSTEKAIASRELSISFNIFDLLKKPITSFLDLATKDGKYDKVKFDYAIMQARAVKASYELIASPYLQAKEKITITDGTTLQAAINDIASKIDTILVGGVKTKNELGLTADDALLYLFCSILVEIDNNDVDDAFMEEFINANYNFFAKGEGELDEPSLLDPESNVSKIFATSCGATASFLDWKNNPMQSAAIVATSGDFYNVLGTASVILVDSNFVGALLATVLPNGIAGLLQ